MTRAILYSQVWQGTMITAVIIALIALVAIGFFAMAKQSRSGCLLVLVIPIVGMIFTFVNSNAQATDARDHKWDAAIRDQATYAEILHGVWIDAGTLIHTCQQSSSTLGINETGCVKEQHYSRCTEKDKDGHCTETTTYYTPWFKYEEDVFADTNVYKASGTSHVVFAEHLAPEDWRHNAYNWTSIPYGVQPDVDFNWTRPQDWVRIKQALAKGVLLPSNAYHPYVNWEHADTLSLNKEYTGHIPEYKGLLPTINHIYDGRGTPVEMTDKLGHLSSTGYDYNVVQFLQLSVPTDVQKQWETAASYWVAMTGPTLQASTIVTFVPADKIPDQLQWIRTVKAYLMDENTFHIYILPKNLILLGCGVNADLSQIEWCRMETGMFGGNESAISSIAALKPFPFTPQDFFGQYDARFVAESLQPQSDGQNLTVYKPSITFTGGKVDQILRDPTHGFQREQMADLSYKSGTMVPDKDHVDAINRDAVISTALIALLVFTVIGGVVGYIIYNS